MLHWSLRLLLSLLILPAAVWGLLALHFTAVQPGTEHLHPADLGRPGLLRPVPAVARLLENRADTLPCVAR